MRRAKVRDTWFGAAILDTRQGLRHVTTPASKGVAFAVVTRGGLVFVRDWSKLAW